MSVCTGIICGRVKQEQILVTTGGIVLCLNSKAMRTRFTPHPSGRWSAAALGAEHASSLSVAHSGAVIVAHLAVSGVDVRKANVDCGNQQGIGGI